MLQVINQFEENKIIVNIAWVKNWFKSSETTV